MKSIPRLAAAALLAALAAPGARAQNFDVQTHTLKNGMKILVQEDHSIPNVALYIFYKIGSRNERPGATGLSHFFEHMMFNGARKYGPGMFDRVMEDNGGSITVANSLAGGAVFTIALPVKAEERGGTT